MSKQNDTPDPLNPLALSPDEREETAADRWAKVNEYRIKNGMEPIKIDDD